jgi:L-ascorbate metabolism protein UlaG (beta-lactamase superfamily)
VRTDGPQSVATGRRTPPTPAVSVVAVEGDVDTMRVRWVGHATILIEAGDVRVLTDPLLTRRLAHLRRRRSLPEPDVVDVDAVLISHAHLDHLHLGSLRRLRPTARCICPRGTGDVLRRAGIGEVVEVDVGDRVDVHGVTVDVVPAAHSHGRGPHSRVHARPVGYIVSRLDQHVYFPGDTDLFDEMSDLGPIDVALLPIWGWGPTIGTGHLDPARAALATELIVPKIVVPIHWGTYAPEDGRRRLPHWFDAPPDRFADELAARGLDGKLHLVEPGGPDFPVPS